MNNEGFNQNQYDKNQPNNKEKQAPGKFGQPSKQGQQRPNPFQK